jgi:molybdopterin synthase sulfur carrier subunit
MAVVVKFFASFREATGKGQESIEEVKNVASLLDELVRRFGEKLAEHLYHSDTREIRKTVNILVNGRSLDLPHELDTLLKDGDIVAIFPPVSGG